MRLNHDSAEHLHVAFALERGERPYLDFIENHPMLFELGILLLKEIFPQETVLGLFMLVRLSVFLAFAGCVYYVYLLCRDYCNQEGSRFHPASILLLVFIPFGILTDARSYLWDARPDWFCYLMSLACIHGHYSVHSRPVNAWGATGYIRLALGAVAGGVATALLPKSLHIFSPYALLVIFVAVQRICSESLNLRRLFGANILFLGIGILAYVSIVAAEVYANDTSFSAYYKANFVINRLVHIGEGSHPAPLSQLSVIAAVELPTLLIAVLLAAILLLAAIRDRKYFRLYTLMFSFSVVVINCLLLATTNRAYWLHNFAPSLLALLVVGFVLMHSILNWLARAIEWQIVGICEWPPLAQRLPLVAHMAVALFVILLGHSFAMRIEDGLRDYANLHYSRTVMEATSRGQPAELPADRLLPSNLTYLVFNHTAMPLRARQWGYYFMLSTDRDFWRDNYTLDIGPDAESHWRDLYSRSPPDAVLLDYSFSAVKEQLLDNQGVDISWLEERLGHEYVRVCQSAVNVYIRSEHIAQFGGPKWTRCDL